MLSKQIDNKQWGLFVDIENNYKDFNFKYKKNIITLKSKRLENYKKFLLRKKMEKKMEKINEKNKKFIFILEIAILIFNISVIYFCILIIINNLRYS
jgi:hypothetical protein